MTSAIFKKFKILLVLVVVLFLFLNVSQANAAPYFYSSIRDIAQGKILIRHKNFDEKLFFTCNLSDLKCQKEDGDDSQIIDLPETIESKNYFFNKKKDKLFVSEEIQLGKSTIVQNAIYSIIKDGSIELESILPTHERVFRAIFSLDGSRLIIISRQDNILSINLDKKTVVFKETFKDMSSASRITLSPNGKFLAYYISPNAGDGERKFKLWSFAENKVYEWKEKISYWDLISEDLKVFDFSPDSGTLVYLDDRDDFPTLYKVNLKDPKNISLKGEKIISKPYTVSDFIFGDNGFLYFTANRENPLSWSLYSMNAKGENLMKIRDGISYAETMKKTGDYIIYLHMDADGSFPEILNTKTSAINLFPTIARKGEELETKGEIIYVDKRPLALLKPPELNTKTSHPLIVWLHGGPYRQTSLGLHPYESYAGYDTILKEAQKNGAIVLKMDYIGSYGYGRNFAESIKNNVGKKDVQDVLEAISQVKSKINIGKVYVMGNSYGGYLALRTIVEKPEIFDAAISINGVTDWESMLNQLSTSIFNIHFDGLPKGENQKMYDQASILSRLDNLKNQKIILIKSEKDSTIPPRQSDILYEALKQKNKKVELVNYPEEDHVIEKKEDLKNLCLKLFNTASLPTKNSACSLN